MAALTVRDENVEPSTPSVAKTPSIAKSKTKKLLIRCKTSDELDTIVKRHQDRRDSLKLNEIFERFSQRDAESLWKNLLKRSWFGDALGAINPEAEDNASDSMEHTFDTKETATPVVAKEKEEEDSTTSITRPDALEILGNVTLLVINFINAKKPTSVSKSLQNIAFGLHSCIFRLATNEDDLKLQKLVAKLCELYWTSNLTNRDHVISQFIPYVLLDAFHKGTSSSIKKLYTLRECVSCFDFDDQSSGSLRKLLRQCFVFPQFLMHNQGVRFLSYVFTLNENLMVEIHNCVLNQIATVRKSYVKVYANIYFQAWSEAEPETRRNLEFNCFQNVLQHAADARTVRVFNKLHAFMEVLHEKKSSSEVDDMLMRVYEPILWRALKVANPIARHHAVALLASVFPLQSSEIPQAESDALFQKQYEQLYEAMVDPSPKVRVVAVEGVCRVLGVFWELVPAGVTKKFTIRLIKDLCFDASSSPVRAAVFRGLTYVLDNHLSHALMREVLPTIGFSLHDKAERVRCTFLDLLLRVKTLKDIHFIEICPLEHLLERFSLDAGSKGVASRMTQLLANSYFPTKMTSTKQLARMLNFAQTKTNAALAFCEHIHAHVSAAQVFKFVVASARWVHRRLTKHASRTQRKRSHDSDDNPSTSEEESVDAQEDNLGNAGLMVRMMTELLSSMRRSRAHRRSDKTGMQKVLKELNGEFMDLVRSCIGDRPPVRAALMRLAQLLQPDSCGSLMKSIMPELTSLTSKASEHQVAPLTRLCCHWQMEKEVLDKIQSSLVSVFKMGDAARVKRKRRNGAHKAADTLNPSVALSMLQLMLDRDYSGARQRVLQSAESLLETLAPAMDALRVHLHRIQASKSSAVESSTKEVALNALLLYCKINVHTALAACGEDEEFVLPTPITGVIQWFERNFAPLLQDTQESTEDETETDSPASSVSTEVIGEPASPPRRRQRKRASSKHTPTHNGTRSASTSAGEIMSFVWQVTAAVTGVASECASLGASDEGLLGLARHCAISVRSTDESSAEKKACCQYLCKLLCAFSTRCDEESASRIEAVLRMVLKHKIPTNLRSNVQFALTKCMTGNANGFFLTSFAKSLAQELLQCSNESEQETTNVQRDKLQLLQDSIMVVLKRQSESRKYIVRVVQEQANVSSCLSEGATTAQRLECVQAAMSAVLLVNCVFASVPSNSFRNHIMPTLVRLLQQLGAMQPPKDTDDELNNWTQRLEDALKLIVDT